MPLLIMYLKLVPPFVLSVMILLWIKREDVRERMRMYQVDGSH